MRVLIAMTLFALALPAAELPVPERRAFLQGVRGESFPKFQNGIAVVADFTEPTIHTFSRDGNPLWSVTLRLPDARQTIIGDVTVSPDGTVGASLSFAFGNGSWAAYLAWVGRKGVERLIKTTPFTATNVSFSPDGKLRAFGREHTADFMRESAEYNMLRVYDREGKLFSSSMPRSTFPVARPHPGRGAHLVSSADRLGLHTPSSEEWIEIPLDGGTIQRFRGPAGGRLGGVAMIGGDVFASVRSGNGFALVRLDRGRRLWVPVPAAASAGFIYGADDGHLVIGQRVAELIWVRPAQ